MNRRDFLKSTALAGVAVAIGSKVAAVEGAVKPSEPDLVAVTGGEPAQLLAAALKPLGGMKAFVKPGQKVVVKPNIGWNRPPEAAADTNPDLVRALVLQCFEAGAASVTVFDHTCDRDWRACYKTSGIEDALADTNAVLAPANIASEYREVAIARGKALKVTQVNHHILDCDVFINVPVLKNHGGAKLTACMKNFMGIVYDRREFHNKDLQQCIADSVLIRRPDLNILDAYRAMQSGGPRGTGRASTSILSLKSLLASRDIVAIDTAGAQMLRIDPQTVGHLLAGEAHGFGTTDLGKLTIERIRL